EKARRPRRGPRTRRAPKNGSIFRGRRTRVAHSPPRKSQPGRTDSPRTLRAGPAPSRTRACLRNVSPAPRKPAGHLLEGALEQLQDPPVLVVPGIGLLVRVALERVAGHLPLVL